MHNVHHGKMGNDSTTKNAKYTKKNEDDTNVLSLHYLSF